MLVFLVQEAVNVFTYERITYCKNGYKVALGETIDAEGCTEATSGETAVPYGFAERTGGDMAPCTATQLLTYAAIPETSYFKFPADSTATEAICDSGLHVFYDGDTDFYCLNGHKVPDDSKLFRGCVGKAEEAYKVYELATGGDMAPCTAGQVVPVNKITDANYYKVLNPENGAILTLCDAGLNVFYIGDEYYCSDHHTYVDGARKHRGCADKSTQPYAMYTLESGGDMRPCFAEEEITANQVETSDQYKVLSSAGELAGFCVSGKNAFHYDATHCYCKSGYKPADGADAYKGCSAAPDHGDTSYVLQTGGFMLPCKPGQNAAANQVQKTSYYKIFKADGVELDTFCDAGMNVFYVDETNFYCENGYKFVDGTKKHRGCAKDIGHTAYAPETGGHMAQCSVDNFEDTVPVAGTQYFRTPAEGSVTGFCFGGANTLCIDAAHCYCRSGFTATTPGEAYRGCSAASESVEDKYSISSGGFMRVCLPSFARSMRTVPGAKDTRYVISGEFPQFCVVPQGIFFIGDDLYCHNGLKFDDEAHKSKGCVEAGNTEYSLASGGHMKPCTSAQRAEANAISGTWYYKVMSESAGDEESTLLMICTSNARAFIKGTTVYCNNGLKPEDGSGTPWLKCVDFGEDGTEYSFATGGYMRPCPLNVAALAAEAIPQYTQSEYNASYYFYNDGEDKVCDASLNVFTLEGAPQTSYCKNGFVAEEGKLYKGCRPQDAAAEYTEYALGSGGNMRPCVGEEALGTAVYGSVHRVDLPAAARDAGAPAFEFCDAGLNVFADGGALYCLHGFAARARGQPFAGCVKLSADREQPYTPEDGGFMPACQARDMSGYNRLADALYRVPGPGGFCNALLHTFSHRGALHCHRGFVPFSGGELAKDGCVPAPARSDFSRLAAAEGQIAPCGRAQVNAAAKVDGTDYYALADGGFCSAALGTFFDGNALRCKNGHAAVASGNIADQGCAPIAAGVPFAPYGADGGDMLACTAAQMAGKQPVDGTNYYKASEIYCDAGMRYCDQRQQIEGAPVAASPEPLLFVAAAGRAYRTCVPVISGYASNRNTILRQENVKFDLNCLLYDEEGRCIECDDGFTLYDAGEMNQCIEKAPSLNVANCLVYDDAALAVCGVCEFGGYLDGATCRDVPRCDKSAEQFGECTTCINGLTYNKNTHACERGCEAGTIFYAGGCKKIEEPYQHCEEYDLGSPDFKCKTCQEGYYKATLSVAAGTYPDACISCEQQTDGSPVENPGSTCKAPTASETKPEAEGCKGNQYHGSAAQGCIDVPHCFEVATDATSELQCELGHCHSGYANVAGDLECRDTYARDCGALIENCRDCTLYYEGAPENGVQKHAQCSRCTGTLSVSSDLKSCVQCGANCLRCEPDTSDGALPGATVCYACEKDYKSVDGKTCTPEEVDRPFCVVKDGSTQRCITCAAGFAVTPAGGCLNTNGCRKLIASGDTLKCGDGVPEDDQILNGTVRTTFSKLFNAGCAAFDPEYLHCTACRAKADNGGKALYLNENLLCVEAAAPCTAHGAFVLPSKEEGKPYELTLAEEFAAYGTIDQHCAGCEAGYHLSAEDELATCVPCPKPGATACDEGGVTEACLDGLFKSGDGCAGCLPGCATCGDGQSCLTCEEGLVLDTITLDLRICRTCQEIFGESCYACGGADTALACTERHPLRSVCYDQVYTDEFCSTEDMHCKMCGPGTDKCADPTPTAKLCGACEPQFYLAQSFQCTPCSSLSPLCSECQQSSSSGGECLKCPDGFTLTQNDRDCESCLVKFSGARICMKCVKDVCLVERCESSLNESCKAPECASNCKVCGKAPGASEYGCMECEEGYYIDSSSRDCAAVTELHQAECAVAEWRGAVFACLKRLNDGCVHGTVQADRQCMCTGVYFGTQCDKRCVHGIKEGTTEAPTCNCGAEDYVGTYCEVPCVRANADIAESTTACFCNEGFGGADCSVSCAHGTVNALTNKCVCTRDADGNQDYYGDACDVHCIHGLGDYVESLNECQCRPGHRRTFAVDDKTLTGCEALDCKNGATYSEAAGGSCACTEGYQGTLCEVLCADGYGEPNGDGACECRNNRFGPDCNDCLPHYDSACDLCDEGFARAPDSGSPCIYCIEGRGALVAGKCVCEPRFGGYGCSKCAEGYYGPDCITGHACKTSTGHCDRCGADKITCIQWTRGWTEEIYCADGWAGQNCDQCAEGYYGPDCMLSGLACGENAPQHCEFCTSQDGTLCLKCADGWTGTECDSCADGYLKSSAGNCIHCVHGTLSGELCQCTTGWGDNDCATCVEGKYGDACDQGALCTGDTTNCLSCERLDTSVCEKCIEGFQLSDTKNCIACSPDKGSFSVDTCTCINHHTNPENGCQDCDTGYELATTGACIPCEGPQGAFDNDICSCSGNQDPSTGCTECLPGYGGVDCEVCENGWFGDKCDTCAEGYTGEKCQPVAQCEPPVANCAHCLSGATTSCIECEPDYLLTSAGACVKCAGGRLVEDVCKCPEGYDLDTECVSCLAGYQKTTSGLCIHCDAAHANFANDKCTCAPGYDLASGCTGCKEHYGGTSCERCETGWDGTECKYCASGYVGEQCKKTAQCSAKPFDTCESCFEETDTICAQCASGYYLSSNNLCIKCDPAKGFFRKDVCICINSGADPTTGCTTCKSGHYGADCEAGVLSSITGCGFVSEKSPTICLECRENYQMSKVQTCVSCDPNKGTFNGFVCSCTKQNSDAAAGCASCLGNWAEPDCATCATGYYGAACEAGEACTAPADCAFCKTGELGTCLECADGFTLADGACTQVPPPP